MRGWTLVFRGPDYAAQTVAAALEASGFRAETMTDTGNLWPGLDAGQTRVFVPEEEAEEAMRVIERETPPAS